VSSATGTRTRFGSAWQRSRRRGKTSLVCGAIAFFGLQLGLSLVIERWFPVLRDPEYAYKTAGLCTLLAEEKGRPSVVVLGSSRSALGFRPGALASEGGRRADLPVVYNYAFTGAGPIMELVCLQRLLRAGIQPDWIIVEVHPCLLHQEAGQSEDNWTNAQRLSWADLRILQRYSTEPRMQRRRWYWSRLLPGYTQRFTILSGLVPEWLPTGLNRQDGWRDLDRFGWQPYFLESITPEQYQHTLAFARYQYRDCFPNYRITPNADGAMRELLATCRREGIAVLLLTMPEGRTFQSWYSPEALATIHDYLTGLCQEYGIGWIDARSWVPDDGFFDNHHLMRHGAAAFSARFGREVLQGRLALASSPGFTR
jgi:hypothetical protein